MRLEFWKVNCHALCFKSLSLVHSFARSLSNWCFILLQCSNPLQSSFLVSRDNSLIQSWYCRNCVFVVARLCNGGGVSGVCGLSPLEGSQKTRLLILISWSNPDRNTDRHSSKMLAILSSLEFLNIVRLPAELLALYF